MMSDGPGSSQRERRIAYAQTLDEYDDQWDYYDGNARTFKSYAQQLDLFIILCGALVAAIPILNPGSAAHWTEILVSFLGAAVVIGQGAQRVFRHGEIWPDYRQASERMKSEWRLFINGAGAYDLPDPDAQKLYVETLEAIMAEEKRIFFKAQKRQQDGEDIEADGDGGAG